jgi:hypothetical protein
MQRRGNLALTAGLAMLVAAGLAAPTMAEEKAATAAKTTATAAKPTVPYKTPRNSFGDPDLQGIWTNATITPFERPAKYGDSLVLSAEEAAAMEKDNATLNAEANAPTDPNKKVTDLPYNCGRGFTGVDCGYNNFWVDPGTQVMRINGEPRSSMIVDPPNGRMPPLTPEAQKRLAARFAAFRGGRRNFDNPEVLSLGERCILSFGSSAGPPMIPLLYNNNYSIVQTKDAVAIEVEMVHDVRVVRMNGVHPPSDVRLWMGDSIGHWEGDTLVVETTNLRKEQGFRGASENLKVTERFTRVSPTQILYRFTIDDPTTFTQPWSGEVAMNATKGPLYEYACHEGNHAMEGILRGARFQEQQEANAKPAGKSKAAVKSASKSGGSQ